MLSARTLGKKGGWAYFQDGRIFEALRYLDDIKGPRDLQTGTTVENVPVVKCYEEQLSMFSIAHL